MNLEVRVKLIRSLEEIKDFEQRNFDSSWWKISAWGGIIFYSLIVLINLYKGFSKPEIFRTTILLITLPIPILAATVLIRHKFNEKYKLLAGAILELGSIAQEHPATEIVLKKTEVKVNKAKKQSTKRKKK